MLIHHIPGPCIKITFLSLARAASHLTVLITVGKAVLSIMFSSVPQINIFYTGQLARPCSQLRLLPQEGGLVESVHLHPSNSGHQQRGSICPEAPGVIRPALQVRKSTCVRLGKSNVYTVSASWICVLLV